MTNRRKGRGSFEKPQSTDISTVEKWEAAASKTDSKGYGAAGYALWQNLTTLIPGITGHPVRYPVYTGHKCDQLGSKYAKIKQANFGNCNSENPGIIDIIEELTVMSKKCPEQRYVLGGHSQGGLIHVRAITLLPKQVLARILAVTMVQSPQCPASVKDKCRSYCNKGDEVSVYYVCQIQNQI